MLLNGQRIAKVIAHSGYCSRRDAEVLILEGRVKVDGDIITAPGTLVSNTNTITIDDTLINTIQLEPKLWLYHKKKGLITSHKDELNRKTVFQDLPSFMPRVISIGRLDYNTEGLLLLTNNGALARAMELPSNRLIRRYKCRAFGHIDSTRLTDLKGGVTINGIRYSSCKVSVLKRQGINQDVESKNDNIWFEIEITEGKNREVRHIMKYCGLIVNRLIRTGYGPFSLNASLQPGMVEEAHINTFKKFLKCTN